MNDESPKASADVATLIATKDWSNTPLGPPAGWPASLQTVLRLMISSRYAMWMGWGPELTFFCNDTYRNQTLGKKYPWAIGQPAREVWAEIWNVLEPRIRHVLATGEATWDEGLLLLLERSGYSEETYHSFSYSAAPADEAGRIGGLFCVVVEETERVIGERRIAFLGRFAALLGQVRTSEEVCAAFENTLSTDARDVPFSVTYLFDPDGTSARRFCATGFDGDHPAAPHRVLLDERWPWPLAPMLSGGGPMLVELDPQQSWPTGPWKLAPSRALLLPIASASGESGRPVGVMIVALSPHRPFSDKIREFLTLLVGQLASGLSTVSAYEAERRRAEALAEVDRAKTNFFSNISHEFRTPLTLMLAPIEDMRAAHSGDGEDRERLELLHRNALRLLKLVNTLLDFSRVEAGRVEALYEATDLAALTRDLASNFRSALQRAGLALVVDCPPMHEPVYVDRAMWEKIVLNLLSNAFKFTFEGNIAIRLHSTGDAALLEVQDTGTGIAENELPRVFERFHRVEGARSRSHEGSGIGLALVHELVRMHGGRVDVVSRLGEGTTFYVKIPKGNEHLDTSRVHAPRTLESTAIGAGAYVEEALRWIEPSSGLPPMPESPARVPDASWPTARIVVADDNADMREYVTRLLGERWDVEPVANGKQALESIRRHPPDLVLSDVMMPELDGFGLLRAVRNDPGLQAIPIVLLSARAGEEATSEGLKAGADDYIVKPFAARDLLVRVAARLTAGQARVTERRRLLSLLKQVPAIVNFLRGPDLVFEFAHPLAVEAAGGRELFGKKLLDAIPEYRDQPFYERLRRVYETGQCFEQREAETRLIIDGREVVRYWDSVYLPVRNEGGHVEGVMTFELDVTRAVVARRELELASRAKDEFLATMSHELRTPLNSMLGWATMLVHDDSDRARRRHGLEVIERSAQAQARLVSDLLDVSRIITGKLHLSLKRVQISSVIVAAVETVRPAAEAKRIRLVIDIDPDVDAMLGDPDRLQQIIWNLLSNAVRHTPSGGRVSVTAERRDSTIAIHVKDTGEGVPKEHLAHIFERFRQVDSSMTRAHGGLGLGLAIVRHLTEAHGGTVSALSQGPNQGATFSVTLPVRAVNVADAAEVVAEVAAKATDRFRSPPAELRGVRVLVVDDDRDSLDLQRLVLEEAGASVQTVTSAREALETREAFDVIVSDIGMPEMDGHAFMRRIRARDQGAAVPAIALTAYARSEDAERAMRAGYQEHLAKPVDAARLVNAVRTWARIDLQR